jgi:hypothetical protein
MLCSKISRKSLSRIGLAFLTGLLTLVIAQPSFAQSKSKKSTPPKPAQEKPAQGKPPTSFSPNAPIKSNLHLIWLSMEVNAIRTMKQLQLDNNQLVKVAKLSLTTVSRNTKRAGEKENKVAFEKMLAIRNALLQREGEANVSKMTEEFEAFLEKEKIKVDDHIEISDAARKEAVTLYRMLRAEQLASYLGQIADGIEDPVQQVMAAIEEVSAMSSDEWKDQQGEIVDEIAEAVAGLDEAKAKDVNEEMLQLLTKARGLKKADLEKQLPALEQAAKKIVGDVSAETVLRNRVQVDLATLLSNDQLHNACNGLMKANQTNGDAAK